MSRIILTADEGKIYTNGEIYGKQIYLAEGASAESFRQVTLEEYLESIAHQQEVI